MINSLNLYIDKLSSGEALTREQAYGLQEEILTGQVSTQQLVSVFGFLEKRRLSENELFGFYQATQFVMAKLDTNFETLDTCGTGGDHSGSFNISTAAALVCAAAGVPVAKHGNRAASSHCGSADVLEALGINIELSPERAAIVLKDVGFVFLFARNYHPAFKHVAEARKLFGKKTYFNLLGPLLNPAAAAFRVHGLADFTYAEILGKLLITSGVKRAWLLHAEDGLDEISPFAPTKVLEFQSGKPSREFKINPDDFGLARSGGNGLKGGDAAANARIITDVFQGRGTEVQKSAVILNAAAGLTVFGQAKDLEKGIKLAAQAISSCQAYAKLEEIKEVSKQ